MTLELARDNPVYHALDFTSFSQEWGVVSRGEMQTEKGDGIDRMVICGTSRIRSVPATCHRITRFLY